MRGDLRGFEVERPRRLRDALVFLAVDEAARPSPLAGGTDLFVALNDGHAPARRYLDLTRLDELRGVARDGGALGDLRLGALATYTDLRRSSLVARRAPALAEMAATVGAPAIQNRGTLGGSLANASPASDPAPLLQALDARIELAGLEGGRGGRIVRRVVPSAEFFTGYRTTAARPHELIVAVRVPGEALAGWRIGYRKVGARRAQAISKVVLAVALKLDRRRRVLDARVSIGSVAPVTLLCGAAAAALRGARLDADAVAAARAALAAEIRPIDDVRSTAAYRSLVAGNLLEAMLGTI